MNKIARLRNPWNSCGAEVPQKPKNHEDDDEEFEHERFLSIVEAAIMMLVVQLRRTESTRRRVPAGGVTVYFRGCSNSAIRAFTSFRTRATGSGFSAGNRIVPLEVS